jgi:hypothetical protein
VFLAELVSCSLCRQAWPEAVRDLYLVTQGCSAVPTLCQHPALVKCHRIVGRNRPVFDCLAPCGLFLAVVGTSAK